MAYLLIVDDDEDFTFAASKVLSDSGYEVAVCDDPTSAIAELDRRTPDLMILDVMFPEDASAGFELARAIRARSDGAAKMPILMLTAVNRRFPLGFGLQDVDDNWLPVSDFVEKPVELQSLPARIESLLSGQSGDQAKG